MVIYGCDIRYEEASKSEELDPNLPAVVVPLQIFETSHTIGGCFYKNNFLKMIATHPQATNYNQRPSATKQSPTTNRQFTSKN